MLVIYENVSENEALELLEDGDSVYLECEGYTYEIGDSENWIGGQEGKYLSEILGNVLYDSAKLILKDSIEFFTTQNKQITIKI